MAEKKNIPAEQRPFVTTTLGTWSSHPAMLKRQRIWLRLLGWLPLILGIAIVVWMFLHYQGSDFAAIKDNNCSSVGAAIKSLAVRCGRALQILLCSALVTLGFSVTTNLLWGISRKLSRRSDIEGRDSSPVPISLFVFGALFWLVPCCTQILKGLTVYVDLLIVSNICCFLPFVLLWIWVSTPDDNAELPRDQKRHPYGELFAWVFYLVLALYLYFLPFLPKPQFVSQFAATKFVHFITTHCPWILTALAATAFDLFWLLLKLLAYYFAWKAVVHFIKWRLKWVAKKQKKAKTSKDEAKPGDEGEVSEAAKHLLEHLPAGIELEGEIAPKQLPRFSPLSAETNPSGLAYLIDLPEGAAPTKDQVAFFKRFVSSFEDARGGFFENEDPRAPQKQADILLHGDEGSGRTTILLASALYAAIVRGQRVLYIVPSRDVADRLAKRVNARLKDVLVDCYFSAGVLKPIDVGGWLAAYGIKQDENGDRKLAGDETLPPDVLFATPEMVERCFFSNVATLDADKRNAMRRLMLDFSVFLVDDFLEYPLPVRSHLAFVLDKFRLLLATEFVVPQFVVATAPLDEQLCIEILGQRLFGFNRFNRHKNVCEMHPRPLAPYLCGTLVVRRGKTLEQASRELLQASLGEGEKRYSTLLYRRGLSEPEKAKFDEDFKDDVKDGNLRVVSHLYELEERKVYDNVFYLSLTCGNAHAALRLNMLDDGTPVFFRIKMEGEEDVVDRDAMVLLPDETATSLRAFHLRSVLQFIPRLTPVEASVWSCLGIFREHPNVKDAAFLDDSNGRVSVQWYQDELPVDERYAEGQIWSYLVMATNAVVSTRGQLIDFNVLPNTFESIWVDRRATGLAANRLLLVKDDVEDISRQMVSWRDAKNVRLGETDLAHADELVCRRKGVDGEDAEEYTVAGLPSQDELDKDPGRFAMAVTARYRRGTEEEFLMPVKRIKWSVPTKELEVVDLAKLGRLAYFKLQLKADTSCRVNGFLKGLLNLRGRELDFYPPREFAYDSYMTCLVLKPTLKRLGPKARPEDYVLKCMTGNWGTTANEGFSSALTHALTAAFRQIFSGWSFFVTAPVFYIEGREDSVGKAVMWLVEPANSGRTVGPVLKALFEETAFWKGIFQTAYDILKNCKSLQTLRLLSRLAFADEHLDDDDLTKARALLEELIGKPDEKEEDQSDESEDEGEDEEEDGSEDDKGGSDEKDEAQHHSLEDYTPEEHEFESVVLKGLENFDDIIDVSKTAYVQQNISKPHAVSELYLDVLWNHPEIFYVAKRIRYQYWKKSDGTVGSFVIRDISYAITKAEYPEAKAKLDAEVASAMAYMAQHISVDKKVLEAIDAQQKKDKANREEALKRALEQAKADKQKESVPAEPEDQEQKPVEDAAAEQATKLETEVIKEKPKEKVKQPRLSDLTDPAIVDTLAQKARYLHDYIVKVCDYDHEAADTNDGSPKARTVYAVLVRHLAVCEGYTMAYRYLLDQVGIDSEEVYSRTMCHIWNFVKLGGNWYHVDVTWDDPVGPNRQPLHKIYHNHFLLSDTGMRGKKHTWNGKGLPAAEDTRYDGKTWA